MPLVSSFPLCACAVALLCQAVFPVVLCCALWADPHWVEQRRRARVGLPWSSASQCSVRKSSSAKTIPGACRCLKLLHHAHTSTPSHHSCEFLHHAHMFPHQASHTNRSWQSLFVLSADGQCVTMCAGTAASASNTAAPSRSLHSGSCPKSSSSTSSASRTVSSLTCAAVVSCCTLRAVVLCCRVVLFSAWCCAVPSTSHPPRS